MTSRLPPLKHSTTPCDLENLPMSDVKKYFENTYDLYEELFRGIKDESAYFKYPDALRLPLIFYYGHTAAVYINKLMLAGLIEERVKFDYESLFETGVDEMSWDDVENFRMGGKFVWPSVSEVQKYRDDVRKTILKLIDTKPIDVPVTQDSPWWSLFMGMEHERIHFDTSSVLIRQLPIEYVSRPANWEYGPLEAESPLTKNSMLKVQNCTVTIGKPRDFPSYGWDNEYGEWTVRVPEFEASKYLVTNREFLVFVKAGGYENKSYWSDDGWKWRSFRQAKHPTFWVCKQTCKSGCGNDLADYSHCCPAINEDDNITDMNGNEDNFQYKYRAIFDVIDMPLDWPAEVNYFEAKAFCAWKGPEYRLLTEAEHHAIRGPQKPLSMGTACDPIYQENFKANINMKYGSSTPVNMFPASKTGFHDVFGNVWCWMEDQFNGLPGFETHYLYDDFSTPTFDGKHFVILGGSWASTGDEASCFARYAFRPHFFQHLGFRLARSINSSPPPVRLVSTGVHTPGIGVEENRAQIPGIEEGEARYPSTNNQYVIDTEEFLQEELTNQYGDEQARDPFTEVCLEYASQCNIGTESALSLLCSTGRQAFELSKHFDGVTGVDYSGLLIEAAQNIQQGKNIRPEGPGIVVKVLEGANVERVTFKQLTWLPNEIGKFDFVAVSGLDRLCCPEAWLARMREIVKSQGLLAIETPKNFSKEKLLRFFDDSFSCVDQKEISKVLTDDKSEGLRPSDRCHSSVAFWIRH